MGSRIGSTAAASAPGAGRASVDRGSHCSGERKGRVFHAPRLVELPIYSSSLLQEGRQQPLVHRSDGLLAVVVQREMRREEHNPTLRSHCQQVDIRDVDVVEFNAGWKSAVCALLMEGGSGDDGRESSDSPDRSSALLRGLLAEAISSTIDEGPKRWHEGFMDDSSGGAKVTPKHFAAGAGALVSRRPCCRYCHPSSPPTL